MLHFVLSYIIMIDLDLYKQKSQGLLGLSLEDLKLNTQCSKKKH